MNRNLKILFTLSVILNVLLIGVSGGMVFKHRHGGPGRWMEEAQHGMSPESRNLMAREFQESHKQIGPLGQKAREAREKIVQILSSPEFNEGEFDAAIESLRDAQQSIMAQKMSATKRIAAQMPQEERAKLAKHFEKSFSGRWNKDPGKQGYPPPPPGDPDAPPPEGAQP